MPDPALLGFWPRVAVSLAVLMSGAFVVATGWRLFRVSSRGGRSAGAGLAVVAAGVLIVPVGLGLVWMGSAPTSDFRPTPLPQPPPPTVERRAAENATPAVAERIRAARDERIENGQADLDTFRRQMLEKEPPAP